MLNQIDNIFCANILFNNMTSIRFQFSIRKKLHNDLTVLIWKQCSDIEVCINCIVFFHNVQSYRVFILYYYEKYNTQNKTRNQRNQSHDNINKASDKNINFIELDCVNIEVNRCKATMRKHPDHWYKNEVI